MATANTSNKETHKIDGMRQLYMRRRVLHICAAGDLLRAPEGTEAKKGGEVVLESVTVDKAGNILSGVVLVGENEERETWFPWPDGHISTRRRAARVDGADGTEDDAAQDSGAQARGPALARAQQRPSPTRARGARA